MKGFRFYADLRGGDDKWPLRTTIKALYEFARTGGHVNCIALLLGDEHRSPEGGVQEALQATFGHADSDVSLGAVAFNYLRTCKRVPEHLARKLHPRLFERLDQSEQEQDDAAHWKAATQ